ncbi:uncharacterized protein LOC128252940 [Drosophila gunungcola]|uniref:Uncharacterized protein n=1 Tax=Drosophila gunungcola TaxID=103775 RepID=A0A9P9YX63_9MUSC|nr:uncharacterized protein LOC128252940 [Drosophila gunungcola]KAI8044733.1 hypothetical protein M5D96_000905 [Drosophila gunungcola]
MRLLTAVLVTCAVLVVQPNVLEARKSLKGHHRSRGKPRHVVMRGRTSRTAGGTSQLQLGDLTEMFYNHCHDIFKEKNLVGYVIRGMIGGILDRLNEVCVDKPIHPLIHRIFTETLLCGGSLSEAIDSVIDIIFGQFERKCREKHGFESLYVLTSADNEIVETKHIT